MNVDCRVVATRFTTIVASNLHYQDMVAKETDKEMFQTASQVTYAMQGWKERYRNDAFFHARVQSITAQLIQSFADDRSIFIDDTHG